MPQSFRIDKKHAVLSRRFRAHDFALPSCVGPIGHTLGRELSLAGAAALVSAASVEAALPGTAGAAIAAGLLFAVVVARGETTFAYALLTCSSMA